MIETSLSNDFPVCPWCGCEQNHDPDGIESTVCILCDKTFLVICKVIKVPIPGTIIGVHFRRTYETRKMIED